MSTDQMNESSPETSKKAVKRKVMFNEENTGKKQKVHNEESSEEVLDDINGHQSVWASPAMPTEILMKIFSEVEQSEGSVPVLIKLSKTCRLWRDVASTPLLWRNVNLSTQMVKQKYQKEKKLLWLLQNRLTHVTELSLSGWKFGIIKSAVQYIAENCTELRVISFAGCKNLPADTLLQLVRSCTSLESLDLSGTWTHSTNTKSAVSLATLTEILKLTGGKLRSLNLANNTLTSLNQIITLLSSNCPNLETLDLSNLRFLQREMVQIKLEQLQMGCQKMKILRLTNSPVRLSPAPAEQRANAPGFPNLEELSIAVSTNNLTSLDNSALERILKNTHSLKLLDIRGCASISSSSLIQIPSWDLRHLFLSGSSATKISSSGGLDLVIRKWRHSLVELDLSWSYDTASVDEALVVLAEDRNTSLKKLDLCGSSVSYEPVKKILDKCDKLQVLNLTSCRALPRGIKRVYKDHEDLENLKREIENGRFDSSTKNEDS